ncbi:MAG: hypothetical protein HRT72_10560, partial [Flavobacteriales bacterium]|nr:hypothetical protein [Flavobacteriales bacterium]
MKTIALIFLIISTSTAYSQIDSLFWPTGKIRSVYSCLANSCTTKLYYETTGTLKEISVNLDGYKWIYSEEYCENGQLKTKFNPSATKPEERTEFHCNGNIFKKYSKSNKGIRGEYTEYYLNGNMSKHGFYEKTNKLIGEQKSGIWEYF